MRQPGVNRAVLGCSMTIATIFSIITAGVAVGIAYAQWRTAHQRLILDLFDRRSKVYADIEGALHDLTNELFNEGDFRLKAWGRLGRAERDARFLFGDEVSDRLATLKGPAKVLIGVIADPEGDLTPAAEERVETFLRMEIVPLFAPYMLLNQRMPGFWWPWRWDDISTSFRDALSRLRRPSPR
jgi:hypothetical protein